MGGIRDAMRSVWRRMDNFLSAGINPEPVVLCQFRAKADIDRWRVFSDSSFGGLSQANVELGPDSKTAVFSGRYSKALGGEEKILIRSGYCGINQVRRRNMNLSMHDYLDFRVKGDGHTYIASVRTDQLTGGDEEAWQAPLPTRSDGQWENIRLEFEDFIFTFRGRLVKQSGSVGSMPRDSVMSVGITLAASEEMPVQGDFRLELASVTASAYEVDGPEARRKAYRGDQAIRPDAMWDRSSQRVSVPPAAGETLGGRRQRGSSGAAKPTETSRSFGSCSFGASASPAARLTTDCSNVSPSSSQRSYEAATSSNSGSSGGSGSRGYCSNSGSSLGDGGWMDSVERAASSVDAGRDTGSGGMSRRDLCTSAKGCIGGSLLTSLAGEREGGDACFSTSLGSDAPWYPWRVW